MIEDPFKVEIHDRNDFASLVHELLDVYEEVYRDRLSDPFFSLVSFGARLSAYAQRDGFAFTTGRLDGKLIGYALGYRLPADTRWWDGMITPINPGVTRETGSRTFALNEIMVLKEYRLRGYGRRLHDQLLLKGTHVERRVTLLVEQDNTPAITAYLSWGYQIVGQLKPFDDAPVYHEMIKDPL